MLWLSPRPDFYYAPEAFAAPLARDHLIALLKDGEDPARGFHHPDLKPNRFHARPKYPVKKYMCLGLYWNPLDYLYHDALPDGTRPWPIAPWLQELAGQVVGELFPQDLSSWRAQTALVNYYTAGAKMGMHVDKEERDHRAPVIGISFGGTCKFLFEDEHGDEQSFLLPGNSVYCFGGTARMMRHGIGTTYKNTLEASAAGLLQDKERLSVTLRKVD